MPHDDLLDIDACAELLGCADRQTAAKRLDYLGVPYRMQPIWCDVIIKRRPYRKAVFHRLYERGAVEDAARRTIRVGEAAGV